MCQTDRKTHGSWELSPAGVTHGKERPTELKDRLFVMLDRIDGPSSHIYSFLFITFLLLYSESWFWPLFLACHLDLMHKVLELLDMPIKCFISVSGFKFYVSNKHLHFITSQRDCLIVNLCKSFSFLSRGVNFIFFPRGSSAVIG